MMSTEQRVAMRSRWEAYQEMLTTSAEASGGNAPAASDTPVQGGGVSPLYQLVLHFHLTLTALLSLIVHACFHGPCATLQSQDLSNGRKFYRIQQR